MNVSIIIPLLNESESINELNDWIFKTFVNTDFKFEVIFDFLQSPLNVYLVQEKNDEDSDEENHKTESENLYNKRYNRNKNIDKSSNILKNSNIDNSQILDFGEIYENRSSLLVKNLPPGKISMFRE